MSGNMFMYRLAPTTISTVAKELIHIHVNASVHLVVHEAQITCHSTVSQVMQFALCVAGTTDGPGSTLTPHIISGNNTALSTGYGLASTNATGLNYLDNQAVNSISGYVFLPTPELRPTIKPGAHLVLRCDSTHAEDLTCLGFIKFEELY